MARILADLSQPRQAPQHSGRATLFQRAEPIRPRRNGSFDHPIFAYIDAGFVDDRMGMSEGTDDMCKGKALKPDLAVKRLRDHNYAPHAKLLETNKSRQRHTLRQYTPVDAAPDAEPHGIYDRVSGVRYAVCRGHIQHVLTEASKLAQALGGTLRDLHVRAEEPDDGPICFLSS